MSPGNQVAPLVGNACEVAASQASSADKIPEIFGGFTSSIQSITSLASLQLTWIGIGLAILGVIITLISIGGFVILKRSAVKAAVKAATKESVQAAIEAANNRINEHVKSENFRNHVDDSVERYTKIALDNRINEDNTTITKTDQRIDPLPGDKS